MKQQCGKCGIIPGMVTGLLRVYDYGDPYRMIEILTDLLGSDNNLHPPDRLEIVKLIHLLTAIARQREGDNAENLNELKKSA